VFENWKQQVGICQEPGTGKIPLALPFMDNRGERLVTAYGTADVGTLELVVVLKPGTYTLDKLELYSIKGPQNNLGEHLTLRQSPSRGGNTGPVDVLRTAHHGSATSSNAASVATFSPSYAIISVGTDNTYCHPVPAVLSRIAAASSQVIATGAGIDLDADDCGYATSAASNVELGAGDIVLDIDALGEITRGEAMRQSAP